MLGLCRNTWSCCWKKKLFAHISKKWTLKVNLGSNWVFGYLSIGYLSISTFESLPCAIKYARMVEASGWQGEEKNLEKTWSTTKQKLSEKLRKTGGRPHSCWQPSKLHVQLTIHILPSAFPLNKTNLEDSFGLIYNIFPEIYILLFGILSGMQKNYILV